MNHVTLFGRLGAKPELKYTQNGTAVANLSLATSKRWYDKDGVKQERTEWHRLVAFGKQAETLDKYLDKGNPLLVTGELQTRKWEDKEGQTRYTTEINIDSFEFTGVAKKSEPDIPF